MNDSGDPEVALGFTPYVTSTQGIKIMVWPHYDEVRSQPSGSIFYYRYVIKIVNESSGTVQLVSRHWMIGDGFEHVEEVRGDGVIGKQPVLSPGETFSYSSFCPIRTPSGWMKGSFQMRDKNQNLFDAKIDTFQLQNKMMIN